LAKRFSDGPLSEEQLRRWHRLFGLLLTEHLSDSPFTVALEMDLSQRQQFLDVVIVRRRPGVLTRPLPDGLDDLVAHNLITFKSFREALTDWALKELTGHYVNYRKQVSPRGRLIPENQFRMYAVCARRPRDLFGSVPAEPLRPGVYSCGRGTDTIRIVVASEMPRVEQNAMLHLFSAAPAQIQYGAEHYRTESGDISSIVNDLFAEYSVEGLIMPYTMADYKREKVLEHLHELTAEERLAGLPPEQIEAYLKRLRTKPDTTTTRKKKPKKRGN
jgi:hypothetical protein